MQDLRPWRAATRLCPRCRAELAAHRLMTAAALRERCPADLEPAAREARVAALAAREEARRWA